MPFKDNLSCLTPDSVELEPTRYGKLDGKTFVVKDLIAIKGHVSSFGNARWRETHPASETTSPIITKLLSAGAHLIGTAKLDQLAGSLVGNIGEGEAPINSLYPDRFTGGSSSGSAAAVAGRLVDFALGTDTAGSVRVPAAACGIYGFRPTYNAISSEGVLPWGKSFDAVGILSQYAGLIRKVFEILCDHQEAEVNIKRVVISDEVNQLASPRAARVVRKLMNLRMPTTSLLRKLNYLTLLTNKPVTYFRESQGEKIGKHMVNG